MFSSSTEKKLARRDDSNVEMEKTQRRAMGGAWGVGRGVARCARRGVWRVPQHAGCCGVLSGWTNSHAHASLLGVDAGCCVQRAWYCMLDFWNVM